MNQMRGCVITSRRVALFDVDFSRDDVADVQNPFVNFDLVDDQALSWRIGINNRRNEGR